jgi:Tol biopolymer transport system component
VIRLPLLPPEGTSYASSFDVPFAVSPDGRYLTHVAVRPDGTRQLWLRALDTGEQRVLPGTEGAAAPFWSPDGRWVAFFAAASLKKVRVSAPITQVIASSVWADLGGAAWNRDDVIVVPGPGGMHRVSANGGSLSGFTHDTHWQLWPQFVGDGSRYLFASFNPHELCVGSLSGEEARPLMSFSATVSGLSHAPGFVFYVDDGALLARPFDDGDLRFTGPPQRIVEGVPVAGTGSAPFSVSAADVLAFSTEPVGMSAVLRWYDRDGRIGGAVDGPAKYLGFSLSPDGARIAMSSVGSSGGGDLWVRDVASGASRQLTFDGLAFTPHWSPDGRRLVFTGVGMAPPPRLFVVDASLTSPARALEGVGAPQFASGWDAGRILSATVGYLREPGDELWTWDEQQGATRAVAVNSAASESEGRLSPDGSWVAFTTDRSGRDEVWVARFPSGAGARQLSPAGGRTPVWCGGTGEIVYLNDESWLVSVPFSGTAERLEPGTARPLFRIANLSHFDRTFSPTVNAYAASSDCQRFLVATQPPASYVTPVTIIAGWRALLSH